MVGIPLHAGDIGRSNILEELEHIAPTFAVRGNIDPRDTALTDTLTVALVSGESPLLTVFMTHIAVSRVRLRRDIRRLAFEHGAQLVICGHSHIPWLGKDGELVVFNPGSIGPKRSELPVTFGLLDISPEKIKLSHVDCTTGERWLP